MICVAAWLHSLRPMKGKWIRILYV